MKIQRLLRPIFGVTNQVLNEAIQAEQAEGAVFGRLIFPVDSLKHVHLIQFHKPLGDGSSVAGLGSDRDEKRAYRKAVFEYFERKAVLTVGVDYGFDSTNGVGAHRYPALAFRAGLNELYERDAFLRHWYSQSPFLRLETPLDSTIQIIINEMVSKGYKTLLCKTRLGFVETTLAFLVDQKTDGFALGLSSGRGSKEDVFKAFLEAAINLFFGNEGKSEEELISRVKGGGIRSLTDHRTTWLLVKQLPDWVLSQGRLSSIEQRHRAVAPKFERVVLVDSPVPVVGARSEGCLDLSLGLPGERDLAILDRAGLLPKNGDILPHPIP